MRSELASAFGLLAGILAAAGPAAARPDIYARSQQMRRQNAQECLEDLEDILDNAPTTSLSWGATACDYTSTLSGAELTATYASFRSRMASWYSDDLDDITKIEASCTQYASVFSQIRYCYVTGPVPTTTAAVTTTSSIQTTTGTGVTRTSTSTVTATPTPDGGNGLDAGEKAGLAIGIVLAVLLLMFIGYKTFAKYRSKRLAETSANENKGSHMEAAVAGGAVGAAGLAAAAAGNKARPTETSVYAFKSELSGESRPMSELDPAAAVAAPRTTGPLGHVSELDSDPPTQLSELPADNYDPTAGSPPPAYLSPFTDTADRSTVDTIVSPLSPDTNTVQSHGLGISSGQEAPVMQGANSNTEPTGPSTTEQNETVQFGWGRGWMRKG
ncbi:hypothetical protein EsH8_III_000395 [Colletotrichum jinshuiense]